MAEFGFDGGEERGDRLGIAYVAMTGEHLAAIARDLSCCGQERGLIATGDDDGAAFGSQSRGEGKAEATAPACNKGDTSF